MSHSLPNYFLGLLPNGIPVYCNVEETVKTGVFVPLYTSKRRVKIHNDIVASPNTYFDLLNLGKYIQNHYQIPNHILVAFVHDRLSLLEDGRFPTSRPLFTIPCISYSCGKTIVILGEGVQTCPHCNRSFMVE